MHSLKHTCEKLLGGISKRTLMLVLALTVTLAATAGGTLAFLYGTQSVKNTFTYGDISIDLDETDTGLDGDTNPDTNQYQMYPGRDITKDPRVTVFADSMDCWLFVEMRKSANFDEFMEYTIADGWTEMQTAPGVYYRAVDESSEDQIFPVILDDVIKMKESVTMEMLSTLTDADYPQLTITAYAIQRDSQIAETADAETAWTLLPSEQ